MIYESDRNMVLGSSKRPPAWTCALPAQKKAYHAIQMSDVMLLREALAEGADLHDPIRPLLVEAAQRQQITLSEYLLARGAQVDFPNSEEQTAAYLAAQAGEKELLDLLSAKGADVQRPDRWKTTPLMTATFHGHLSCVEFLVNRGANVNARDQDGLSVLGHVRHGRAAEAWQRRRSIRDTLDDFHAGALSHEDMQEALEQDFAWLKSQEEAYAEIKRLLVKAGAIDCKTPVPRLTFPKIEELDELTERFA